MTADPAGPADDRALGEPVDVEPLAAAIEHCFDMGWTDGLPVVPPAPGLVRRMLEHTSRSPSEVIWRMSQVYRTCTVELAAINAVMAGCRPEYFPVVLAALEATIAEGWPGAGGWQSTTGGGPLHIVNGPARTEHGFNARGNVLGQGFRANATVGRAVRLVITNVYGIRPHELDQSTQGMPGKYTLCIAENEEESPWQPLHVELGFAPGDSTVSAIHVRSCEFVDNRHSASAEHLLGDIADTISRTGSLLPLRVWALVVLGPEHAQLIAGQGYTKADVREHLAERCARRRSDLARAGKDTVNPSWQGGMAHPGDPTALADDGDVPLVVSPDHIVVVVAGARNAGVSTVCHPLGFLRGGIGTALVERPA